jgi:hypothetical protein
MSFVVRAWSRRSSRTSPPLSIARLPSTWTVRGRKRSKTRSCRLRAKSAPVFVVARSRCSSACLNASGDAYFRAVKRRARRRVRARRPQNQAHLRKTQKEWLHTRDACGNKAEFIDYPQWRRVDERTQDDPEMGLALTGDNRCPEAALSCGSLQRRALGPVGRERPVFRHVDPNGVVGQRCPHVQRSDFQIASSGPCKYWIEKCGGGRGYGRRAIAISAASPALKLKERRCSSTDNPRHHLI